MSSTLKVDILQDSGGNNIIASDGSGSLTTQKILYPAWFVYLSTTPSLPDSTTTKIQFDTVEVDTDSGYDNSTNYRYTIPSGKGGKYLITYNTCINANTVTTLAIANALLYKNGSSFSQTSTTFSNNYAQRNSPKETLIMDLDAGDYLEVFCYGDVTGSNTQTIFGSASLQRVYFGGYRIGD